MNFKKDIIDIIKKYNDFYIGDNSSRKEKSIKKGAQIVCGHCSALNSHNHTYFSVMDGIASPENMIDATAMKGWGGIGVSDHGTMGGVLRAGKAAKKWQNIKVPIKNGNYSEFSLFDEDVAIKQYVSLNLRELDLTSSDGRKYLSSAYSLAYSNKFLEINGLDVIKDLLLRGGNFKLESIAIEESDWTEIKSELLSDERYNFLKDSEKVKGLFTLRHIEENESKSKNTIKEALELLNHSYLLCTEDFIPVSAPLEYIKNLLLNYKNLLVVHNINNTKQWRCISAKPKSNKPDKAKSFIDNWDIEEEFEQGGEFKAISGCELYVSWEDQKEKRYNHITVYATGQKGHRALVLLTSIGAIPSRRYKGASGFIRPRIFVEDLAKAVEEAEGELIVTTGCPISITSEALRKGNETEARRFFTWATNNLPKENFFAELHLCDVSLDWNEKYKEADGKYFASLFNTPVARFRHSDEASAKEYAELFLSELRIFSTAVSIKGKKLDSRKLNPVDLVQEEMFDLNSKEGIELLKKYQTSGVVRPLLDAGIKDDIFQLFSKDEIEKISIIDNEILENARNLLKIGTDVQTDEMSTEGSCEGPAKKNYEIKNVYGRELVKVQGGRYLQLLDEDTLALLSKALEVIDYFESNKNLNDSALFSVCYVARAIIYIITKISIEENISYLNPIKVLSSIFGTPHNFQIGSEKEDELLSALATDRLFCLDMMLAKEFSNEEIYGLVRSLHNFLKNKRFIDKPTLNPMSGPEDGLEKEWNISKDGNWMNRVNKGLIDLAREFDVPLLLATDSHMTDKSMKFVQDALMKRGKRRAWHMAVPYAVPRANLAGLISDLGDQWKEEGMEHIAKRENTVYNMISNNIITASDLVESIGSGSIILEKAKSAGSFKWNTAVPKIKYDTHPLYEKAKAILDSGELADFLCLNQEITNGANKIKFTDNSLNVSTALIVIIFLESIEKGSIPAANEYYDRILSELYLMQEVPNEQLCDFFLILQFLIDRWRKRGISVGPGRGSSGGMLTAKISGITYGDPIVKGFLEARWMNRGRKMKGAHADIDIDVSDRQLAGYELAIVAKDALEESIKDKPLSNLESILFKELFFSSVPVSHEDIGGLLVEKNDVKKDIKSAFIGNLQSVKNGIKKDSSEEKEIVFDDSTVVETTEESMTVVGTPLIRVGTYQSLKAKAAVKEAIRIADKTSFDLLPSFAEPSNEWLSKNKDKFWIGESGKRRPMTDEEKNRMYEDEFFSHMSFKERISRRRVRLGDRITKAMAAGAGLARLYQSELDYFKGSVYADVPDYWDVAATPPTGSEEAKVYFMENPSVEDLTLDMLNIYKAPGVHAGGFCIGREVFERIPVRADKYGYVSQFEMKDIENVGILKFDVLGLKTLSQVSETLKFIVAEESYENLSWWMPRTIYDRIKNGESTDISWHSMPKSTPEALDTICDNRMMTFQIDTKVFGKELDKLGPNRKYILGLLSKVQDVYSNKNDKLTDILNAFLALFRPGPMKSNSHIKYIERLLGKPWESEVIDKWLMPYIGDTFGLIVYQEQVMKIYSNAAILMDKDLKPILNDKGGFIPASEEETDEVRRAMGKKDMSALNKLDAKGKFLRGLNVQGVSDLNANKIWDEIEPFAEYGFNSPHSYHYGIISAVTLFLKAHYQKYFFRVTMGLADATDASRFLSEIQRFVKSPDILYSDEVFWEIVNEYYYPGLSSIEGLKTKDIEKILETRKRINKSPSEIKAKDFFEHFGKLTPSIANLLSKSGALRSLGTQEEIADAYLEAIKKTSNFKDVIDEDMTNIKEPPKTEVDSTAEGYDSINLKPLKNKKQNKPKKQKEFKLGKKEEEIYQILLKNGPKFVEELHDDGSTTKTLTIESALDMVTSNRTKGSGIRHLTASVEQAERSSGSDKPLLVMIKSLKQMSINDDVPLEPNSKYRIIGIPRSIGTSKSYDGKPVEPKVVFTAEGTDINLKFSKKYPQERLEADLLMLKDGKMSVPFMVEVFAGSFRNERKEVINYYKIESIEKISID